MALTTTDSISSTIIPQLPTITSKTDSTVTTACSMEELEKDHEQRLTKLWDTNRRGHRCHVEVVQEIADGVVPRPAELQTGVNERTLVVNLCITAIRQQDTRLMQQIFTVTLRLPVFQNLPFNLSEIKL